MTRHDETATLGEASETPATSPLSSDEPTPPPTGAPCSDAASLGAAVPPPRDPDRAARVEEVRQGLARLVALRLLGKPGERLALVRDLLVTARSVDDAPILAETLLSAASAEIESDPDGALDKLYESSRLGRAAPTEAAAQECLARASAANISRR